MAKEDGNIITLVAFLATMLMFGIIGWSGLCHLLGW
jgi:hypothetical protein